jgi:hypothetical protein
VSRVHRAPLCIRLDGLGVDAARLDVLGGGLGGGRCKLLVRVITPNMAAISLTLTVLTAFVFTIPWNRTTPGFERRPLRGSFPSEA